MLENLTLEGMQSHLGTEFRVEQNDDPRVVLTLVEIRDLVTPATKPKREGLRSPFSLLFQAPSLFQVPQQTLRMEHSELGTMDIFVVPVDQDDEGLYYEAVFN